MCKVLTPFRQATEKPSLHAILTDLRDRKLLAVDSGRTSVSPVTRSHGISTAPGAAAASYEAV